MKHKNDVWWFLGIVLALSYAWQYLIYASGGVQSRFFPLLMWIPGLVAVFFLLFVNKAFRKIGWGLRKWQYLFPAIFIPLGVSLGLMFLIKGLRWGTPLNLFVFDQGLLVSSKIHLMLGNQPQSVIFFAMNLILSHLFFLVSGSILTLGEELGWRGYAQEKILRRFGLVWGFVILGAVWGYWHLPIILMGYNFPNQPVLGALLLMPLGTVFLGIFLGWIYLRSKSIWLAALAHASVNLFSGFLYAMKMNHNELSRQLIWIAAWGIVAVLCMISLNKNEPMIAQASESHAE